MAILADISRRDVRGVLAGRIHAIVTIDAIARDVQMIKISRYPGSRRVAIVAVVTAADVAYVLAGCRHPVVARGAGTQHLEMIYPDRR